VLPAESVDQATGLRRLFGEQETFFGVGIFGPDAEFNAAAAASLAYALGRRGSQVCVLDELEAPRNVAGYLGIGANADIGHVARGALNLADAMAMGPAGVRVLNARGGAAAVATMPDTAWRKLGEALHKLAPEWMLVTAAEGNGPSLALACPRRLLVLPADKSRLPEAYAVLKAAHQYQPDGNWRVLVMNARSDEQAEQLMAALVDTASRFLDVDLDYAGAVPRDEKIHAAARSLRALLEMSPEAPAARAFRGLAEAMPGWAWGGMAMGLDVFWQRLGLFSRMSAELGRGTVKAMQHGRAYG
jgi:flagellar biosynthesis protein FlhG